MILMTSSAITYAAFSTSYCSRFSGPSIITRAINSGGCPAASFALTEAASDGFQVEVTCTSTSHIEGTTSRSTLQIQSTGSYGSFGDRDYVSRTLNVTVLQ